MKLAELYAIGAQRAMADGIDPADQDSLVDWIRRNCDYREGTEFFIVLGIGAALADLRAQAEGYKDQFDRAIQQIRAKKVS